MFFNYFFQMRSLVLAGLSLVVIACERKPERAVDTAPGATTTAAKDAKPREPEIPQYREVWLPLWELALLHTDSIDVGVSQPATRCQPSGRARLGRDMEEAESAYGYLVLAVTNEPFDSIARLAGFERRGDRWVTVGYDGNAREAIEIAGSSSRTLRGAGLGTLAPPIPTSEKGIRMADTNSLRHHRLITAFEHPKGCTVALRYFPNFEGADDTAAVRKVIESVRIGPDALAKTIVDSAAFAQATPDDDTTDIWAGLVRGDNGIGLVIFDDSAAVETVTVYAARDRQSAVVARIARDLETRLQLLGVSDTTVDLSGVEYAYETLGLVGVEVTPDTGWARIEYANDSLAKDPRYGWVDLSRDHVRYASWSKLILARGSSVSFSHRISDPYHASPDGARVPTMLVGRYSKMTPAATEGDWMLVRAEVPDDECEGKAPRVRESFVWIRYLDARGRPLVFYAPRGC